MRGGTGMRMAGIVPVLALLLAGCAPGGSDLGGTVSFATPGERVAALNARLAQRPNDPGLLSDIGAEHARAGRWDAAAGAYREALLVDPGRREANLGYGRALIGGGRYDAASAHALAAVEARRDREALLLAGVALTAQGRVQEGVARLAAARAADPRDLTARTNLALALALARDGRAYGLMREVAFAPDADPRHRRNLILVAGMLGLDAQARADAPALGISGSEAASILALGRRARTEGARAFGVASAI